MQCRWANAAAWPTITASATAVSCNGSTTTGRNSAAASSIPDAEATPTASIPTALAPSSAPTWTLRPHRPKRPPTPLPTSPSTSTRKLRMPEASRKWSTKVLHPSSNGGCALLCFVNSLINQFNSLGNRFWLRYESWWIDYERCSWCCCCCCCCCCILDACLLPRAEGPCSEHQARWYFDQNERRCAPFYYGGCHGNANNFDTSQACQHACSSLSLSSGTLLLLLLHLHLPISSWLLPWASRPTNCRKIGPKKKFKFKKINLISNLDLIQNDKT